jgi:hypothetical protein
MHKAYLFLGFVINEAFAHELNQINPILKKMFIQEGEEYLHEILYRERPYLGKFVPPLSDLSSIESLEINIYSLLRKLVPDYPYAEHPLTLFPVMDP